MGVIVDVMLRSEPDARTLSSDAARRSSTRNPGGTPDPGSSARACVWNGLGGDRVESVASVEERPPKPLDRPVAHSRLQLGCGSALKIQETRAL